MRRIGLGATAEVFVARQRGRDAGQEPVALKRLLPPLAQDPEIVKLFLREIKAMQRIDHANVAPLLDHGTCADLPFLVLPWYDGASLRQLLRHNSALQGSAPALTPEQAVWIAKEIAQGLGAAHAQGVVHRDVTPTNVQITGQGHVIVLDFGIARVAGLAQTTQGQALRGKWAYLSPEQLAGGAIDGRSDLFALGSVLWEMITGTPPFQGSDPHDTMARVEATKLPEIAKDTPISLRPIWTSLTQLLAQKPQDRPAHAEAVVLGWQQWLDQCGVQESEIVSEIARIARAAAPMPTPQDLHEAAELRGEAVTSPELDPDATQVRASASHSGSNAEGSGNALA